MKFITWQEFVELKESNGEGAKLDPPIDADERLYSKNNPNRLNRAKYLHAQRSSKHASTPLKLREPIVTRDSTFADDSSWMADAPGLEGYSKKVHSENLTEGKKHNKKGLTKKEKAAHKKPGGSNVGEKRKTSGAHEGPFCGSVGGSFPVTNKKQWHAAKSYAHYDTSPSEVKKCADRVAKQKGWD